MIRARKSGIESFPADMKISKRNRSSFSNQSAATWHSLIFGNLPRRHLFRRLSTTDFLHSYFVGLAPKFGILSNSTSSHYTVTKGECKRRKTSPRYVPRLPPLRPSRSWREPKGPFLHLDELSAVKSLERVIINRFLEKSDVHRFTGHHMAPISMNNFSSLTTLHLCAPTPPSQHRPSPKQARKRKREKKSAASRNLTEIQKPFPIYASPDSEKLVTFHLGRAYSPDATDKACLLDCM